MHMELYEHTLCPVAHPSRLVLFAHVTVSQGHTVFPILATPPPPLAEDGEEPYVPVIKSVLAYRFPVRG